VQGAERKVHHEFRPEMVLMPFWNPDLEASPSSASSAADFISTFVSMIFY
jgi:hypothetical protein